MLKLFKTETTGNTIRLQSQLYVGRVVCDYILEGNQLKCYGRGKRGFGFYKTDVDYKL